MSQITIHIDSAELAAELAKHLPSNQPAPKAWTVSDVAKFLQVSEETVQKLASAGKIPRVKIGRLWRFDPNEIRDLAKWGRRPE